MLQWFLNIIFAYGIPNLIVGYTYNIIMYLVILSICFFAIWNGMQINNNKK